MLPLTNFTKQDSLNLSKIKLDTVVRGRVWVMIGDDVSPVKSAGFAALMELVGFQREFRMNLRNITGR